MENYDLWLIEASSQFLTVHLEFVGRGLAQASLAVLERAELAARLMAAILRECLTRHSITETRATTSSS